MSEGKEGESGPKQSAWDRVRAGRPENKGVSKKDIFANPNALIQAAREQGLRGSDSVGGFPKPPQEKKPWWKKLKP